MGRVQKHEVGSRAADLRARHHETEMFRFDVLTASLQTRRVRDRDFLAGVSVPRGYADERPRANDSWFPFNRRRLSWFDRSEHKHQTRA